MLQQGRVPLSEMFGRYQLSKLLDEGATGSVYLAEDTQLSRQVKLKVRKFSADTDPLLLERFYREARAAAGLVVLPLAAIFLLFTPAVRGDQEARVRDFENHIRPMLVKNCYKCHNSVDTAKGDLAVDWRGGLLKGGAAGPSIVPGKPEQSLLLKVLRHEIEGLEMPSGGPKLNTATIGHFERWIRDGAVDPRKEKPTAELLVEATNWEVKFQRRRRWWSLQPLGRDAVPHSDRVEHPVDRFLEQSRQEAGLMATGPANRWTVLRRLNYVLTGLPTTEEEMSDFDAAWKSNGREIAIRDKTEQLLASLHFGERWAQHWLDRFRYSEGYGGQGDPPIENASEYRDYIIRALNSNVPYDRLIREHIAGDLLEEPRFDPTGTINESIIGLAQYRFVEHGFFPVDALDELVKFTDNQIDVVTKATLGLTVSCARCHDHKFDAISQRDYHALFGIFASSRPARRPIMAPDVLESRRTELVRKQQALADAIKKYWLATINPVDIRLRLDRFAEQHAALEANPKQPVQTLSGEEPIAELSLVKSGDALEPWIRWKNDDDVARRWKGWPGELKRYAEKAEQHNRKVTVTRYDFRGGLPAGWLATDGTLRTVQAGTLGLATDEEGAVKSVLPSGIVSHTATTYEQAALFSPDLTVDFGAIAAQWAGGGWALLRLVPQNYPRGGSGIYRQSDARDNGAVRWFSEEADFWSGQRAYFHFQTRGTAPARPRGPRGPDGKPLDTTAQPHGSWFHVREVRTLRSEKDRILPGRFTGRVLVARGSVRPHDRESLASRYAEVIRDVVNRWRTSYFTDEDADFLTECLRIGLLDGQRDQIGHAAQRALATLRKAESEFATLARRATPAVVESAGFDQPLYPRGNHLDPGADVPRGFLKVLGGGRFEPANGTGRLQLAIALTAPGNPLFSRVIANRVWHHVFGKGLTTTTDNFGRTGQQPSHPELLDHLALRMQQTGYDIQQSIRYLVTTELFQLSSTPSTEAQRTDPSNKLWTHAMLRRFDAEIVRDHLLSVSGQIKLKPHGPSDAPKLNIKQDRRRGIYVARKRKLRNPFLDTFDMPVPTTTRGTRDVTTSPAQAITLLNSPFIRFQAKRWAEAQTDSSTEESLRGLVRQAYTRPATNSELNTLMEFHRASGGGLPGLTETAHLVFISKEFIYLP